MAYRLYITPAIGGGTGIQDPRRPKYFSGFRWAGMDYGFQPLYLVAADLLPADDAAIIANADVFAFPFNLDVTLSGGQANSARDAFELVFIPAQWVNATLTWRQIARTVAGMFQFMQRLNFTLGNTVLIDDSTKLNVQWSAVPVNIQTAMLQAAADLGYNTSFISPNTQIRIILKEFADQWGARPFNLNEFTF
jgi:hypothetical protein